jgi:hypothetical protein
MPELLVREPEPGGLSFYINNVRDGSMSLYTMAVGFLNSPEAVQNFDYLNLSNEEFVKALYRNILGREGEADGVAFHVNELTQGISDRYHVAINFSRSPENIALVGDKQFVAFNTAPMAVADVLNATEDTAVTFAAGDLLGNDTDADGDALTITSVTAVSGGSVVLNADGTVTFTPASNFHGAASFSYVASDAHFGTSNTATVTVQVASVNDAGPAGAATAVLAAGTEDIPYTVTAGQLLEGFTDVDGDALSVEDLTASNGTVVVNEDGSYTITPAANFNGAVTLSYTVTDGQGGSIAATQGYNLAAVNDAPTGSASAVLAAGTEDTAYTVTAAQLLEGFTDVEGDTLSVADLAASNGTVAVNEDGSFTITPTANFNGKVALGYHVKDGQGGSTAATQSYNLAAVNDAPTGSASAVLEAGSEDTAYTVTAAQLLEGFTDVDGDTLSVVDLTASNGTVAVNEDGSFTITPAANFNGGVTLGYNVTDGQGGSIAATQGYNLAAVNDAPTGSASAVLAAGVQNTAYTVTASQLLAGFVDVDGDALSVADLTASNGTVVGNQDGSYTITPSAGFFGTVTLAYTVQDGNGGSAAATLGYSLLETRTITSQAGGDTIQLTAAHETVVIAAGSSSPTAVDVITGFSLANDKLDLPSSNVQAVGSYGQGVTVDAKGIVTVNGSNAIDKILSQIGTSTGTVAYIVGADTYIVQGNGVAGTQQTDLVVHLVGVHVTDVASIIV